MADRYKELLDTIDAIVSEYDLRTGQFTYVSEQAERILGYPPEAIESDGWRAYVDEHVQELIDAAIGQALQDGEDYAYEHRMRTADGRLIWLHISASVVPDEVGEPAFIRSVALDVTAEKEAEAERERSHSLLQATLDASADAIVVVDLESRATASNRAFAELWAIPQGLLESGDREAVAASVARCVADPVEFRRRVTEILEQDRAIATHDFVQLIDGRTIEHRSMPQRLGREIVGRVWTFRDITALKHAEDQRERSHSMLQATLDATTDAILVVDLGGHVTEYNRSFAELWPIPRPVLRAGDDAAVVASAADKLVDPDLFVRRVAEIYEDPDGVSHDVLQLIDGRTIERDSAPQRLCGEIIGRVWSFRDITEKLAAQRALSESDQRHRETLENVALIAVGIDERGTVTFANDFLLELTGWSREAVVGHDWFERFDDDPYVRADYLEQMERGEIRPHFESTIRTRSGERRDIHWSSTLQHDESGAVTGIATLGEDVTERRRADDLLRSREELFRSLIEHASDVIMIIAADGTSLYESPAVERVLGWKPEELVGKPSLAQLHKDDLRHVEPTVAAVLAGEEPGPTEFRLRHRDGSWRTVEAIGRRRRQDGEWVIVVNYRDVTDQRQLQEQLMHSQKLEAVGRLAGGIAHDFNNLLTAIGGYSQFLAAGFDDDDPRREDALEIVRASDRAAALTSQLLAFSRRQVLLAEVLDLGEVVAGLESLLSRLLGGAVELSTSVTPGCFVRADQGQLEQVITNLALNARDAMPSGGTVELAVRCLDSEIELIVSDSGVGMSPETISHAFEPFYTTKDPGKGTGLGLATVYGIVTQSGGEISITSQLGEGSTFRVVLPLSAEDAPVPVEREEAPEERSGTEGVLLAEDEETIRRLVGEVLERSGYKVFAAANGDEALLLLEEHGGEIDLLLTDVVMPGMSGPDLARAAARLKPSLRILFTSGYTSEPDEAFDDPDVEFIGKPFSPQALVAKVQEVLDAG
jgi:two-component system cell cycle sensor histidine kinase/response regulator CckA